MQSRLAVTRLIAVHEAANAFGFVRNPMVLFEGMEPSTF